MKYAFITSMNKEYYEHCGRLMLKSFRHNFDDSVPLYVYKEGNFGIKVKGVDTIAWNLGAEYHRFQTRWQNQNKKVATFAKKGFSIIHAMNNLECDRLIWLDADTIITRPIPKQLLELISPNDILSSHFGVVHNQDNKDYYSCETGFFILNKTHEKFDLFRDTYTDIYVNDKQQNIRRFYDGEVYGETVRQLKETGVKMIELNPTLKHKTPIPRSILAPYISHNKAGLKNNIDFAELEKEYDKKDKPI